MSSAVSPSTNRRYGVWVVTQEWGSPGRPYCREGPGTQDLPGDKHLRPAESGPGTSGDGAGRGGHVPVPEETGMTRENAILLKKESG